MPEPCPVDLGLPESRGWVTLPESRAYVGGRRVVLAFGLTDGVAAVRRRYALEARTLADDLLAHADAEVRVLSARGPVRLVLELPNGLVGPVTLRLSVAAPDGSSTAFEWPAEIAKPTIRAEARPDRVAPGGRIVILMHNEASVPLMTGAAYRLQRRRDAADEWEDVDPAPASDTAWIAIGYPVPAGTTYQERYSLAADLRPGTYRYEKRFVVDDEAEDGEPLVEFAAAAVFEIVAADE